MRNLKKRKETNINLWKGTETYRNGEKHIKKRTETTTKVQAERKCRDKCSSGDTNRNIRAERKRRETHSKSIEATTNVQKCFCLFLIVFYMILFVALRFSPFLSVLKYFSLASISFSLLLFVSLFVSFRFNVALCFSLFACVFWLVSRCCFVAVSRCFFVFLFALIGFS